MTRTGAFTRGSSCSRAPALRLTKRLARRIRPACCCHANDNRTRFSLLFSRAADTDLAMLAPAPHGSFWRISFFSLFTITFLETMFSALAASLRRSRGKMALVGLVLLAVCFVAMCAVLGQPSGPKSSGEKLEAWAAALVLVIAGIIIPACVIERGERRSPPKTLARSIVHNIASTYATLAVFTMLLAAAAFADGVWRR